MVGSILLHSVVIPIDADTDVVSCLIGQNRVSEWPLHFAPATFIIKRQTCKHATAALHQYGSDWQKLMRLPHRSMIDQWLSTRLVAYKKRRRMQMT